MIIVLILISINAFSEEIIINAAIGDWAPYTSEKEPKRKIAEVIVKEAFENVEIDVKFKYYPWARAYENAKTGKSDITFPWFKNEERKQEFIIGKEGIIKTNAVFFHRKDLDFKWNEIEDLKNMTYNFVGLRSAIEVDILKENGIEVYEVTKAEQAFQMIRLGRMDVFPYGFIPGYDIISKAFRREETDLFTNHPKSLIEGEMFVLVSKEIPNGQEISDKLDEGLKELKESGRYDEIIKELLELKD